MEKLYKALKLLIWVLAFAVILLGANTLYDSLKGQTELGGLAGIPEETVDGTNATDPSNTAPDFTVYDKEGNEFRLSDFRGKPVILNFWASWCGPCKSEMPDFDEAFAEYGEEIHFLMVNLTDGGRETVETAFAFVTDQGYRFPVYYDTDISAAMAYNVYAVPVTYFIDAQGNLVTYASGALSGEMLQSGIDLLLAE